MKTEKSHRGKKKSVNKPKLFFFHNNIILLPLYLSMSEYQPTSIVLAKVKGYPAWPAMVLDESLLPEHISNKTKIENQSSNINFISHSTISIEKETFNNCSSKIFQ